jgi:hypothetical protein
MAENKLPIKKYLSVKLGYTKKRVKTLFLIPLFVFTAETMKNQIRFG